MFRTTYRYRAKTVVSVAALAMALTGFTPKALSLDFGLSGGGGGGMGATATDTNPAGGNGGTAGNSTVGAGSGGGGGGFSVNGNVGGGTGNSYERGDSGSTGTTDQVVNGGKGGGTGGGAGGNGYANGGAGGGGGGAASSTAGTTVTWLSGGSAGGDATNAAGGAGGAGGNASQTMDATEYEFVTLKGGGGGAGTTGGAGGSATSSTSASLIAQSMVLLGGNSNSNPTKNVAGAGGDGGDVSFTAGGDVTLSSSLEITGGYGYGEGTWGDPGYVSSEGGSVTFNGGSHTVTTNTVYINSGRDYSAGQTGGSGKATFSAGTLNTNGLLFKNYGGEISFTVGTLNMTGTNGPGRITIGKDKIDHGSYKTDLNITTLNVTGTLIIDGDAVGKINLANASSIGELSSATGTSLDIGASLSVGSADTASSFAGALEGTGTFTKEGSAKLTLAGDNTYSGDTAITGGTLEVTGTLGASDVYSGAIANSGALVMDQDVAQELSGAISGTGSLTKQGSGKLTLSGANTYSGNTTVADGSTLEVTGTLGTSADYAGVIDTGISGAVVMNQTGNQTLSGDITGTGDLTKQGTGTLEMAAEMDRFAGDVLVSAGTLKLSAEHAAGSGGIENNSLMQANFGGTLSNNVSGTGTFEKIGADTVVLAQDMNQDKVALKAGGLTLDAGKSIAATTSFTAASGSTLNVSAASGGNSITTTSGSVTFENGATLVVDLNGAGALRARAANDTALRLNAGTTLTIGSSGTDKLTVNSVFDGTLDGTFVIIDTGGTSFDFSGKYDGKINGVAASGAAGANDRYGTAAYDHATVGKLLLVFTGADGSRTATWNGSVDGAWDETTNNWNLSGGSSLHVFKNGDTVLFDDTGSTKAVTVGAGMTVAGMTVNNTTGNDYAFTGANGIGATGATAVFTKTGDGTVNFSQSAANDFTSANLNGGRVNLNNNAGALGAGTVSFTNNAVLGLATGLDLANAVSLGSGGGTVAVESGASAAVSGGFAGTGSLTKAGAGLLNLTTASAGYSGAVTVSTGTLKLSAENAAGTGAVVNNATMQADFAGTLSNSVSGSGTFEKVGAGTVVLAQNMSQDKVNLKAGGLTLGGGKTITASTSFSADTGSTLTVSSVGGGNTITSSTVMLADGVNLIANLTGATDGATALTLDGALTISGGDTINVDTVFTGTLGNGQYVIIDTGDVSFDFTGLYAGTVNGGGLGSNYLYSSEGGKLILTVSGVVASQTATWTNSSGNRVWNQTSDNWELSASPLHTFTSGDSVIFGDAGAGSVQVESGISVAWMTVDNSAGKDYTFTGANGIASTGAFTKNGGGTVTFAQSAANGFTSAELNGGRTNLAGHAGALGTGVVTFNNNAVLGLADGINFANAAVVNSTGGVIAVDSGSATASGVVSGAGSLKKTGDGSLVLSGNNTYSGGTAVDSGLLVATNTNALGSGDVVVSDNAELELNLAADSTFANKISGSGAVTKTGSGDLTLTGANSYTGETRVEQGTVAIGNAAAASGLENSSGIYLGADGTLDMGTQSANLGTLNGDGVLLSNGGSVTVEGGDFSGTVQSQSGFTKTSEADLVLSGVANYAGPFVVANGSVFQNGNLTAANVRVEDKAVLGGNGVINSNVVVNDGGHMAPGNSIDTLTVNGDVLFEQGSYLDVEVDLANADRADLLKVTGKVSVETDGGSAVRLVKAENFDADPTGKRWLILEADGGFAGDRQFSDDVLSYSRFLAGVLSYDANRMFLELQRVAFAGDFAKTTNQRQVAGAIDSLPADSRLGLDLLALPVSVDMETLLNELSGEIYGMGLAGAIMEQDRSFFRGLRSGHALMPLQSSLARRSLGGGDALASPVQLGTEMGIWGSFGGHSDVSSSTFDTGRASFEGYNVSLGLEARNCSWRVGGAFRYGDNRYKVNSRNSRSDVDSFTGALYAGLDRAPFGVGAFDVFFGASYGYHDVDATRRVGALGQSLDGDYHMQSVQVGGEVGYAVPLSCAVSLKPYVGAGWNYAKSSGVTEKGGSAALQVRGGHQSNAYTELGVKLNANVGDRVTATVGAGWLHNYGSVNPAASLTFAQGNAFSIKGAPISRDVLTVNAGVEVELTRSTSLSLSYDGYFGNKGYGNSGNAAVMVKF